MEVIMNRDEFIKRGTYYLDNGFNVIPLCGYNDEAYDEKSRGKRPIIAWDKFKVERATDKDIESWAALKPELNLGISAGIPQISL
jgi:hypothetical protein